MRHVERMATIIKNRSAKIGVIGLGYVGLPLVKAFIDVGFKVMGFDTDLHKVEQLLAGDSYIKHLAPAWIKEVVRDHRFTPTNDMRRLYEPDVLIICVPTPLSESRDPDLQYIRATVKAIANGSRSQQLIVLESTTYPGTTRDVVSKLLTTHRAVDWFLAYSPEREDPGNAEFSISRIPKVVGGYDPDSGRLANLLYSQVTTVVPVANCEVAEACKILENTYRCVNIALVNEMKMLCDRLGIDIWEVIAAASTKPFGFQAFQPGPGLGGHCLAGSEWLTVRDAQGVHTVRFEELFARYAMADRVRVNSSRVTEIRPRMLEALSIRMTDGQAEFAPITQLFRRESQPLMQINMSGNRRLTVTAGHPMLVHGPAGITERLAGELVCGDEVVLLATWPKVAAQAAEIDLVRMAVRHELSGIRIMPQRGHWREHDAIVRPACLAAGVAAKDVYRHNTLPLAVYLQLEAAGHVPFLRRDVFLVTGKGRSWNRTPAVVAITEDFARLVGYYLSEGCITNDGGQRTRFCFGSHETELIADTCEILGTMGFRYSLHRLTTCQTVHVKVSSQIFAVLLRDELRCGVRSEDAHAPACLMGSTANIRDNLLAGMIRGDGNVEATFAASRTYRKRSKTYQHQCIRQVSGYFTSSPVLFQQAVLLLQGRGLIPHFHKNVPDIRVCGEQAELLAPLLAATKRDALLRFSDRRQRHPAPRSWHDHGAYATAEVQSVVLVGPGPVYSAEIARNHTFVTSFGVAVHNCIPIDPFYLSWVARKHGMTTRFIELAGEINTAMPAYVVQKLAAALNSVKKPLNGSQIGILGVAYKRDVDDPRESPAFSIMEQLRSAGAAITYNDPHIPSLPLKMRHYDVLNLDSQTLSSEWLAKQDCVLIVTDHSSYDYDFIVAHASLVVDTRNATRLVPFNRHKIHQA